MATHFILVRHGQTEWNKNERFRGRADIPLNETGVAQAQQVATRLIGEKIDAIYSSPLRRALRTAQPIAENHRLAVQPLDGLNDVDEGALEGLTIEEARQDFPKVVDDWLNAPGHVKFPKGESLKTVRIRVEKTLTDLAALHPDQTLVLVSHRVTSGVILCHVIGLDLDSYWNIELDNASMSRFETRRGGYVVTLINDTNHLRI
ncbi:MAG: histidine phosphatase family protein [Chloroflexi bacterium]|nr:histidine phosphatase family protein [Chloroflexota bacterium]